jgi:hypothetical protein
LAGAIPEVAQPDAPANKMTPIAMYIKHVATFVISHLIKFIPRLYSVHLGRLHVYDTIITLTLRIFDKEKSMRIIGSKRIPAQETK